jgi:hypothetical protein
MSGIAFSLPLPQEFEEAAKFDDRLGVVVDAQVADAVNPFPRSLRRAKLFDDECSRLLATTIAACNLTRFQRRKHPLRERAIGINECVPHRGKNLAVGEHVSLDRESPFHEMAGPLDAARPRVRGDASVSGHRSKLAKFRMRVGGKRPIERLRRIGLRGKRRERTLTVARDNPHRLSSHGPDSSTNPRSHGADREVL